MDTVILMVEGAQQRMVLILPTLQTATATPTQITQIPTPRLCPTLAQPLQVRSVKSVWSRRKLMGKYRFLCSDIFYDKDWNYKDFMCFIPVSECPLRAEGRTICLSSSARYSRYLHIIHCILPRTNNNNNKFIAVVISRFLKTFPNLFKILENISEDILLKSHLPSPLSHRIN